MGTAGIFTTQFVQAQNVQIQNPTPQATTVTSVTGSTTAGYVPIFSGGTFNIEKSSTPIFENATGIGIGTTTPSYKLDVNGTVNSTSLISTGTISFSSSILIHSYNSATNIFIGTSTGGAGNGGNPGNDNTCIGDLSGQNIGTTAARNTFLGSSSGGGAGNTGNPIGTDNTFIGYKAGYSFGTGSLSTCLGSNAGNSISTASDLVCVGYQSGNSTTTGGDNTFVGYKSGYSNTTATGNAFFGDLSGQNNTASGNCFFGHNAANANTTGAQNVAVGLAAAYNNATGSNNTCVGYGAGQGVASNNNSNNSFFGYKAGNGVTTGGDNTFCGYQAGFANTTGANNVGVGLGAGDSYAGESNCTFIGYGADASANTLSNASAIGNGASVSSSNLMVFGNTSVIGWGFGVNPASGHAIEVGSTTSNGNGAYLTTGGTWTNNSSRGYKENITQLDGKELLEKVGKLDIARWKYKGTEEYHIGPFAEQFYELFNTGIDNKHISTVDPAGIALACIKELYKKYQVQEEPAKAAADKIATLEAQNAQMKNDLAELRNQLAQFEQSLQQCCFNYQMQNATGINGTGNPGNEKAKLEQNNPNPFSQNTTIKFYIPSTAQKAVVNIADMNGIVLKSYEVSQKGVGQILISGNTFAAGSYNYQLTVDGVMVDSKMMVLEK